MKKILVSFILILGLLGACSSTPKEKQLTIIDGDYGEMYLFTQMAKILIEDKTDYKVKINPTMAPMVANNISDCVSQT